MYGLRLSLLVLWITGCASQRLIVPDEDWQTVPAAQRTSVDRRHDADLAAARHELATASADLAAFQRAHPAPSANAPAPPPPAPPPDDDNWSAIVRDHERTRTAAFARVEADNTAWLRTSLAWRELRVEAATARLEMVICEREVVRARTIDRNLLGTDTYDSAPLRGQFSRAQQRWYAISTRARQARDAFERASASLASSKEAYAQLMRNGPAQLRSQPAFAADERPARLELTAWAVVRSDIRRRRGLRHYLDTVANAPPTLRRAKIRLAARAVVLPAPVAGLAVASEPVAPTTRPAAPTSKPAAPPATIATTATKKPAAPPAATAIAKPATSPSATATTKPAAPPATARLARPAPSKAPAAAAATKPDAPSKTATAEPVAPPPPPPSPVEPAASPMFPSPSSATPSAPTSAAKPAESTESPR